MLKVLKFGGSSMADAVQFAKVKAIVDADPMRVAVVVSAAGKRCKDDHKITDLLYLCHAHLKYGVSCDGIFDMIRSRYLEIRDDLGLKTDLESEFDALRAKMDKGISQDELVSRGEYFAARLMADFLGFHFVDAAEWLVFNLDGSVNEEQSYQNLRCAAAGRRIVIPGFYGAMPDGTVKTFSRGGSDITGAHAAAALGADVYENWTDVSGFLMADPKIVKDPQPIERITYGELRELSYIGAQVLHEGTIFPVRKNGITLNVRNTNQPDHPGTIIKESFDDEGEEKHGMITGIAGRKNYTAISITKIGLTSEVGLLRNLLDIVAKYNVSVEYLPSGIDYVSLVVEAEDVQSCLYQLLGELEREVRPDSIQVVEHLAVLAAVGRRMAFTPGISGKIFGALGAAGINVRMIMQGLAELNMLIGVEDKDFDNAVRVLYDTFMK
ncbi:MAG: aspartate kinase [Oscillospiraceae bacterium]|nr:aspartate kinase [Oscillospiraceae bacterium]